MRLSEDEVRGIADDLTEVAVDRIERKYGFFSEAQWERISLQIAPEIEGVLSLVEFDPGQKA